MDEAELIAQAKNDGDAFGVLYERYYDRIYTYVYYRTGNSHDAEDLTARIFMRAMHHIGKFEQRGVPFAAWLYRIAHNLVANWHRDQSRRQIVSLDDVLQWQSSASQPEFEIELLEDRDALIAAIRRLPIDRQELLVLKFVDRLSNREIGAILERSEGAIKSLYHRTLLSLREDLQQRTAAGRSGVRPRLRLPWRKMEEDES